MSNAVKYLRVDEIVNTISETHKFDYPRLYAVNTSDVVDWKMLNPPFMEKSELKWQFKKTIKKWDILFSEIRPANRHFAKVEIEDTRLYVASTKLMVLRKFNEDVDNDYFYYRLTNNSFLNILQRRAENRICSFPQITFDLLSEYKVPIPEYNVQLKIAKILSTIDDKIELNNKINSELEAMAKELYEYRFIQFDFPDENGNPYKSSGWKMVWNDELKREIPEWWEVKKAKDICPVLTGKEDANFSTPDWEYKFFTCSQDTLRCDTPAFEWKSILIAWNGVFNVKYYNWKFNAYQRTYVLIPEDSKYVWVLYLVSRNLINSFTKRSAGSIIKFITKWDVEWITILEPQNDKLLHQINSIIETIAHNIEENDKLSELRDFLLPMLMNGQVTVK